MKKVVYFMLLTAVFSISAYAQMPATSTTQATPAAAAPAKTRKPSFRSTKEQIKEAQTMLKAKTLYSGEATGKTNPDWKAAVKTYQSDNGLKKTGSLNRATLEKMGIELTDKQKAIPVSPSSFVAAEGDKTPRKEGSAATKRVIFRASKDQITEAQKMLKSKGMYTGEESAKLDDATREALKKYQAANDLKVTGTLNAATLEKMGIELTDKQKADAVESN